MQTGVIAVMGATGNIGKKIADALLKADEKVRALWPVGEQARRTEARRLGAGRLVRKFRQALCRDDARVQRGNGKAKSNGREHDVHSV
jgi:uncharacterized protein YbjT (DUF2867 family)